METFMESTIRTELLEVMFKMFPQFSDLNLTANLPIFLSLWVRARIAPWFKEETETFTELQSRCCT